VKFLQNLVAFGNDVEIVRGDIRDISALNSAMQRVEYVIHHAAEISVIKSLEEPEFVNEVNVGGTINVLSSALKHGVKRLTFASSSAIYGDTGTAPQHEEMLPHPISPYGASKIAGEHYLSCFYHLHGLETVRFRYFNVFGPRQNPKSQYAAVIPKFADRLMAGQELHIFGDGEQTRDFVYVKDIASANYLACFSDKAPGEVFNIAGGRGITVNELAQVLMKVSGKTVDIIHDAPVSGEIKYSTNGSTKARDILGFEPQTNFEDGLRSVVESIKPEGQR
jgi:nucleoside-diphosphate-sugar epimerase